MKQSCSVCLRRAVEAIGIDWEEWHRQALRVYNNQKGAKHRAANIEKVRAIQREWKRQHRIDNGDKERAQQREWLNKNKDRVNEARRANPKIRERSKIAMQQRRAEQPQRMLEIQHKWYQAHAAEYREKNREKIQSYQREYKLKEYYKNPEAFKERNRKRRARQAGAPVNDFTRSQWQAIKEHYGYRCVYCGKKPKKLTIDHVKALSKGGSHTFSNIVPACQPCNRKKYTGPPLTAIQPLLLCPEAKHEKVV